MTKLSVNINKIATLRNARGGNVPNVLQAALDIERFGAHGITVHPRPDERHIRYQDVRDLRKAITTELNVEGYPTDSFIELVLETKPEQVTLVPDPPHVLTSNAGWDTIQELDFLKEIIRIFKDKGIRTSLFVDPIDERVEGAKRTGTDRIELYTESYASHFPIDKFAAIKDFIKAANTANKLGLGVNAGHDLSLENLAFFYKNIPDLLEVSIGHALISDALYFGLENTVQLFLRELKN
jgi:pyridoxine 5-phosphate synthase